VNLEIEVESGVVREPDKLQAKIDYLFKLAKASVDAQLNGTSPPQQPQPAASNSTSQTHGNSNGQGSQTGGNGQTNGNGQGNGNGHRASEKQIHFANQLAELTSLDASSLIDTLKAIKEGWVSLDAAFSEKTAA